MISTSATSKPFIEYWQRIILYIKQWYTPIRVSVPPALVPAVSLMLGIAGQNYAQIHSIVWMVTMMSICALLAHKNTPPVWHRFLIICLVHMLAGTLIYQKQINSFDAWQRRLAGQSINGTITITHVTPLITNYYTAYRHEGVLQYNGLSCTVAFNAPDPFVQGDIITVKNASLVVPQKTEQQWHYLRTGIQARLRIRKTNMHRIGYQFSWRHLVTQQRDRIHQAIKKKLPDAQFPLVSLIFFGKKETTDMHSLRTIKQSHSAWGLYHYLARAGLHCTVIMMIWQTLFGFVPLPFIIKQLLLIAFALIYGLLSWSSIPFLRALSMYVFYKMGVLVNRQTHTTHILLCTIYFFLFMNPIHLFYLDFQLSFGVTFIFCWITLLQQNTKSYDSFKTLARAHSAPVYST